MSHDPLQPGTGRCHRDSLPDFCATLVSAGSLRQAIELVCSSDSARSLLDEGWSLVGKVVAAFLAGDSAAAAGAESAAADGAVAERWSGFGALLKAVAERGNAKELVFALLEQIESHPQSDDLLLAVLPALAVAMARLPVKLRSGMDVVQEVLYGRMAAVVVPAEYELCEQEQEEKDADAGKAAGPDSLRRGISSRPALPDLRLSPGAEECVAPVLRLIDGMATFAENLLRRPSALSSSTPSTGGGASSVARLPAAIAGGDSSSSTDLAIGCSDRAELALLLVKLLGHPLSRLRCEGAVDACSLRLLRLLASLQPDFWRYWSDLGRAAWADSGSGGGGTGLAVSDTGAALRADAIERLSPAAVGNFVYMVLGRGQCLDSVPWVLDAVHVFECCLQPLCALLASGDAVELEKGLQLLQRLLAPVGRQLPDDLAEEHPGFAELLRAVAHYATTSSVTRFRSEFQRLLPEVVGKFASRGRYAVLRRLQHMAGCGRPDAQPTAGAGMALAAYVLLLVKDQVHMHRGSGDPYFDNGVRTRRLVAPAFALPDGDLTDLIEQFDRLMVGLNTAVYLLHLCRRRHPVVTDKLQQQEPVWPFAAAEIRETYLLPLDKCLTMSRVQYCAKLEGLRAAGHRPPGSGQGGGADVDVSVLGLPTPLRHDLTVKAQIEFLESALLRFNLLENVLQTALELSS